VVAAVRRWEVTQFLFLVLVVIPIGAQAHEREIAEFTPVETTAVEEVIQVLAATV